jgi:hypothetical protein
MQIEQTRWNQTDETSTATAIAFEDTQLEV